MHPTCLLRKTVPLIYEGKNRCLWHNMTPTEDFPCLDQCPQSAAAWWRMLQVQQVWLQPQASRWWWEPSSTCLQTRKHFYTHPGQYLCCKSYLRVGLLSLFRSSTRLLDKLVIAGLDLIGGDSCLLSEVPKSSTRSKCWLLGHCIGCVGFSLQWANPVLPQLWKQKTQ